jgi:hypothetical protein
MCKFKRSYLYKKSNMFQSNKNHENKQDDHINAEFTNKISISKQSMRSEINLRLIDYK